jgi:hypothetical protein
VEHLAALGRIRSVHSKYTNGEVVQTAKLGNETGIVATVAGKEVRRSLEIDKILNVVYNALQGNEGNEEAQEPDEDDSQDQS